ncbi:MAG: FAD-dependent oxidoreductase [Myxococcales bacterium]|nr:FAD-dependent oxidoreductase [Myxococcales bacterium]
MSGPLVIVGGGSTGCLIASRASESGRLGVLLLEAGRDYGPSAALPGDLQDGGRNSMVRHDWGYRHHPTTQQIRFPFPRGRVLGGSSAVNTCIALRGQPEDFDEWAALGLLEWSWERCLPAFRAFERDLDFDDDWHGRDGELPMRRHPPEEWVAWQAAFVEACRALGFPACDDSNRPGSHGVGPHTMNKVDGRRVSAAEAFLSERVRARESLTIRSETRVRRVILRDRRVVGVEVEGSGGLERIETDRVLLTAGAIATPGILLRSGLGPRDDVTRIGVDPVVNLPGVGRRLLDHPGFAIFLRPRFFGPTSRRDPLIQTVLRYPSAGSGHTCDMLLQPGSKVNLPRVDLPLVSLMAALGKPRGHGVLRFESADLRARPRIESRLLEDEDDRARAVDAMHLARRLAQQPPLRKLASHLLPRAAVLDDRSRTDAWIRKACDSGYHPCGTAPMGPDGDPNAVTDQRGRVRGVEGLHIGDASLMPTIPSANIHLATLMIGQRIGEWWRDGGLE